MKILIIDATSASLDFATRCMTEGHEVRVFLGPNKNGSKSRVGEGILKIIGNWEPSMNWADIVFLTDNAKYLHNLESYHKQGYPVVGPSVVTADWELNRSLGQRVLEDAGIEVIPSTTFNSYNDAMAFVLKNKDKRYVSKPSGDADKALSYVSKSYRDMIYMLESWKRVGKPRQPFILQEFHKGIEMAVGVWFGKGGFNGPWLENFEHKKLMVGDVGVNTGEMGTALKYVNESKLADMMLAPLEGELYRQGYVGYIDVSVIIDSAGKPWPLEFTTRPGWPLFQIQQVLHPEPVEWMMSMVDGFNSFKPVMKTAIGVVMAIRGFPSHSDARDDGIPVWGINERNRAFMHPSEMRLGTAPSANGAPESSLVTAGNYVITVSGTGNSVGAAKDAAYKHVKELEIPSSPMYRTDIGDRVVKQLPELQAMGFALEWNE